MVYRVLILTKGCFNNNYLLINKAIDIFPRDSICGGNIASKGNSINLYIGMNNLVMTDIDSEYDIFRDRSWFNKFVEIHKMNIGDEVILEKVTERDFYLYPRK